MAGTNRTFVVDDDPSARSGLARLLRAAGYDVRVFASADEFLDTFDPDLSGCLVLDIRMPGMTGEEMQAELNARGVHLPTIVVTADDTQGTRQLAQKMKAVAFFRKPVDGLALVDAIKWVLEREMED